MSKCHGFSMFSDIHTHAPGLDHTQIMVLARMSGFGIFFEDVKNTAKFLNRSEKTIQTAKQKLVRAGYIFELENTGRGKKYLVRADFRFHALSSKDRSTIEKIKSQASAQGKPLNIPVQFLEKTDAEKMFSVYREEPEEVVEEPVVASPLKPSTGDKKPRESAIEREARSAAKWRKNHPELIPILERAEKYLKDCEIPLLDFTGMRKGLALTAKTFMDPRFPEQHVDILNGYFDYLYSDAYLYQLENNRYTPQVTTQYDLWTKMAAIRQFSHSPGRHYDPSKVLTR